MSATVSAAAESVVPNVSIQKFSGMQFPEPNNRPPPRRAATDLVLILFTMNSFVFLLAELSQPQPRGRLRAVAAFTSNRVSSPPVLVKRKTMRPPTLHKSVERGILHVSVGIDEFLQRIAASFHYEILACRG